MATASLNFSGDNERITVLRKSLLLLMSELKVLCIQLAIGRIEQYWLMKDEFNFKMQCTSKFKIKYFFTCVSITVH